MKTSEMKIIVAFFNDNEMPEGAKCILAQTNDYPVRNGSGNSVDEAIEDLCMQLLLHFHNRRIGRNE